MIREIIKESNKVLRRKAVETSLGDSRVKEVIRDLQETYVANKSPQGLSAPQIGACYRVIICRLNGEPITMVNPEVIKCSKIKLNSNEGCESVKNRYIVKRPLWSYVTYTDENGDLKKRFCWWKASRVVNHECDHLEGKLISDYPNKVWINYLKKK